MARQKTISKHFFDDEILGVEPDGTIHLKLGVMRMPQYRFSTENPDMPTHFNNFVSYRDKVEKIRKNIDEENDWG